MGTDLKNRIFGKLTALKVVGIKNRKELWECSCSCGNKKIVNKYALISGNTSSCGCLKTGLITKNLSGKRFGKLLIIKHMGFVKKNRSRWLCKCDCGEEKIVSTDNLTSGTTVSCGCKIKEWFKIIDLSQNLKRSKSANGYIRIRVGRSYVLEHRIVMEQYLGRELNVNENVHHKNENKEDNRIKNLEIINRSNHSTYHYQNKPFLRNDIGQFQSNKIIKKTTKGL
jgi:hypothetical protein